MSDVNIVVVEKFLDLESLVPKEVLDYFLSSDVRAANVCQNSFKNF